MRVYLVFHTTAQIPVKLSFHDYISKSICIYLFLHSSLHTATTETSRIRDADSFKAGGQTADEVWKVTLFLKASHFDCLYMCVYLCCPCSNWPAVATCSASLKPPLIPQPFHNRPYCFACALCFRRLQHPWKGVQEIVGTEQVSVQELWCLKWRGSNETVH